MNRVACYLFLLVGVGLLGCQARAGMPCQGAGDCHSGLICVKPIGLVLGASGVCEPARRGLGDPCARSTDCSAGLVCSNESSGGYYGTCQVATILDGGVSDLGPDLSPLPDLTVQDLTTPPG
jgi:hypothetical protein